MTDLFVYDNETKHTFRVSIGSNEIQGNGGSDSAGAGRFPGGWLIARLARGCIMTIHDWIVLVGGVICLILVVLLIRRAIRDVKRPGK